MSLRRCVGAAWMLVAIVTLALWPSSEEPAVVDACDDVSRLERLDPRSLRGDARILVCPTGGDERDAPPRKRVREEFTNSREPEASKGKRDPSREARAEGIAPAAAVAISSQTLRAPSGEAALLMGRRIDLNSATADELRALPGIGPGLARRIVQHREEAGPFDSIDALSGVKGFGPARLRAMRGWAVAGQQEVERE